MITAHRSRQSRSKHPLCTLRLSSRRCWRTITGVPRRSGVAGSESQRQTREGRSQRVQRERAAPVHADPLAAAGGSDELSGLCCSTWWRGSDRPHRRRCTTNRSAAAEARAAAVAISPRRIVDLNDLFPLELNLTHLVGFSIRNFLGANGCPRRHRRRRRHWLCVCLCVKGGGAQRQARLHSALFTHPHTKPSCSPRGVQQQGAAIAAACRCHCGLPLTARRFCSSCLLSRCVGSELRAATLPQAQALSLRDWARSRRPCRHAHVARPPWYAPQPRRLIFHGALA